MRFLRRPQALAVGAFLGIGAVNAAANAITGGYLLESGGVASAHDVSPVSGPVPFGDWSSPVSVEPTLNYGKSGALWASGSHTGIDFPVSTGTIIRAASSGTVVSSGDGGSYGNQVVIQHQKNLYSQYAHLSRLDVKAGDEVEGGQPIGLSGSTGNSTGPHLHFEVRTSPSYGSDINPTRFVRQGSSAVSLIGADAA